MQEIGMKKRHHRIHGDLNEFEFFLALDPFHVGPSLIAGQDMIYSAQFVG